MSAPRVNEVKSASTATATWFIAAILASATGIVLGLMWDISWHMTVGRDTFWSPPHMLEYVSGLTAGFSCGYVVLRTTFKGTPDDWAYTVRYWGFRGPLGAWITIWGTFAMLISAPFDDWWHNAYGLDVKIVSPPHLVLFLGMLGIVIGALVLTAAAQNRSAGERDAVRDAWLYAIAGGVMAFLFGCASLEYSFPNAQHTWLFYAVWALVFPALLVGYARAGKLQWPATAAAVVFMLLWIVMGQVLMRLDGIPRLAPIYNARTYLWPPFFPVILVVPAFGLDLVRRKFGERTTSEPWLAAAAFSAVFVLLLALVQWPMASFMVLGDSANALFHGHEWPYYTRPGPWQHLFWPSRYGQAGMPTVAQLLPGLAGAIVIGALSSRAGLAWGGWMSRVKR